MGEINGNDAKSDAIGGLIDVGEPQNLSGYRFFHTGDKKVPFVVDNPTTQIGMAFFVAREDPGKNLVIQIIYQIMKRCPLII